MGRRRSASAGTFKTEPLVPLQAFDTRVDELHAPGCAGRVLKVRCDACRLVLVSFNGERNHGQAGGAIYWDELSLRPHNGKYPFRFSALSILFKVLVVARQNFLIRVIS